MSKPKPGDSPWEIDENSFPRSGSRREQMKFLVAYAILAPSSHNTQPWKFAIEEEDTLALFMDPKGWLRVADSDQREWHISSGCALENLVLAAQHFGFAPQVAYFPDPQDATLAARVKMGESALDAEPPSDALFQAITTRHTNHQVFQTRPVEEAALQSLRNCLEETGIQLFLNDEAPLKRAVDELIVEADALEFANPNFREELGYWIGQGVFGTPWLISKIGQMAMSYVNMGKATSKKDSELLMSAPVLGLICSEDNERETQLKVGRIFERIYLTSTRLGLGLQPMSQIVQIPQVKAKLARLTPCPNWYPQQPFRLGYAEPEKSHTPRRPLGSFLI